MSPGTSKLRRELIRSNSAGRHPHYAGSEERVLMDVIVDATARRNSLVTVGSLRLTGRKLIGDFCALLYTFLSVTLGLPRSPGCYALYIREIGALPK